MSKNAWAIHELEMDAVILADEVEALKRILLEKVNSLAALKTELKRAKFRDEYNNLTTREIIGEPRYRPNGHASIDVEEPILLYMESLYIYVYDDEYSLLLENTQWESQCLVELEEKLAKYVFEQRIYKRKK